MLAPDFSICKLTSFDGLDLGKDFFFIGITDGEISLVCPTPDVPEEVPKRDDGWRGFRIQGTLDFSLVGILARISTVLADEEIGIFVISTFDTDYILVKEHDLERSLDALSSAGYEIIRSIDFVV